MKINHVDSDDQFTHVYYVQTYQIIHRKYEVFCMRTVPVSLLTNAYPYYTFGFLHIYYILYITKYFSKDGNQWLIDKEINS